MGDIVITPASNDVNSTAGTLIIRTSDAQAMSLKTSDTDRVYITSAGNVGIGLTNPATKLHVSGAAATIMRLDAETLTSVAQFQAKANTDGVLIAGMFGPNPVAGTLFGANTSGAAFLGTTTLATVHPTLLAIGTSNTIPIIFGTNNTERMRIVDAGNVGIGTTNPTTLLSVGGAGSVGPASGLTFGGDAQANLYRAGEDTIKTDGSLNVAGLIYNANSAYYSSVSKSTTANWGQYTVVLGNASYSSQLVQVSVNGGNLVWAGTFLASCHLSYRPNETWINVKLLECATYNCSNDDVTLLALSNSTTSQYGIPSLVLKTNGAINGGYGTGTANNIAVTVNGPSPNEFVLSSSSWASPYTYTIATSANTKQIFTNEAGRVGIGTAFPVQKFQIDGTVGNPASIAATQSGIFRISNTTDNAVLDFGIRAGGNGAWIQSTDETDLSAYYPLLLNPNGGNVGIGITNPSALFHVFSIAGRYINFTPASASGLLVQRNQSIGSQGTTVLTLVNAQGAEATAERGTSLNLDIGYGGTSTTTAGTIARGARIAALNYNVYDATAASQNASLVFYTATGGSLTEKTRITADGKVGIGITNPTAKLQVVQSNADGVAAILLSSDESTIQGPSANTQIRMGSNLVLNGSNILTLGTNNVSRVYIDITGNVGIGTVAPTAQNNYKVLQVNGTTAAIIEAMVNNVRIGGIDSDSSSLYFGSIGSFPIVFRTAVVEKMRITAAGLVGIGTATPATLLSVGGAGSTSAASGLTFGGDASANLYRGTAGQIRTDGQLLAVGGLYSTSTVGNYIETLNIGTAVIIEGGAGEGLLLGDSSRWMIGTSDAAYAANADGDLHFRDNTNSVTRMIINYASGFVGIGTTAPYTRLDVRGGILRTNTRVSNTQLYPLGHYSAGEPIFEVDPSWSEVELQRYFNSSNVSWAAVADAPGGYCIYINGAVEVGAFNGSGFPYIPVDTDDIFYMECWIQNVGSNQTHYMGSQDLDHNFSNLGGNPGSYGYFVMVNTNPTATWTKVSGYIGGFSATVTGKFEIGTKYWSPMALFNYTAGTGTRACRISGWKVIKVYQPGNRYFSGNIGIGTTSPGAKLDVNGDVYISPNTAGKNTFILSTNASNDARLLMRSDVTTKVDIQANGASYFNGGAVGIGTNSAAAQLHVTGQTYLTNVVANVARNQLTINTNGANYAHFYDAGVSANNALSIGGNGAIATVPTKAIMTWRLSTENVGIGLTNPEAASALHIKNTDAVAKVTIESADASESFINFSAQSSEYSVGFVRDGSNVNSLRFCAADGLSTGEVMRLQNTNVGIGTTVPAYRLDTEGASTTSVVQNVRNPSLLWNQYALTRYQTDTKNSRYVDVGYFRGVSNEDTRGFVISGLSSNILTLLEPSAYLGLGGVTAPLLNIDVASTQGKGIQLRYDTSTGYRAQITPYWNSNTDTRIDFAINRAANVAASVIMSVGYASNVGIGLTNPIEKLTVAGNLQLSGSAGASLNINTNNLGNGNISFDGSTFTIVSNSNAAPLILSTSSFERMRIASDGKVGIGTASPTTLLSVGGPGSTTAASGLTFGADAVTNLYRIAADILKTDANLQIVRSLELRDVFYHYSNIRFLNKAGSNWLTWFTRNTSESEAVSRLDYIRSINTTSGGNLGIGTNTPSGKLHVVSTVAGATVLRTDGTNGTLFSVVDDLSDSLMSVNNSAGLPVLEVFADDRVVAGQYGSGDFVLINNKVGIGTINPTYKLHVLGDALISGNLTNPTIIGLSGALNITGSTLDTKINSLSGYSNANFATILNLAATGSTLDTKINTTNTNLAATGSTLNTKINTLSGYSNATFATITNLAATGSTLDTKINSLSGYSNATFATITNLAATGSTLDTKINSLSGYSNANFATILNLAATGSVLDTKINTLSGYANNTFLSGVGVSNYVPRWSGTKLLVTGSIYDNGNVGIGTQTPSGMLHIGTASYSSSFRPLIVNNGVQTVNARLYDTAVIQQDDVTTLRLVERNSAVANQILSFSIGDGFARIACTAQPMQFYVNGGDAIVDYGYLGLNGTKAIEISTTANVGIGNVTPSAARLHIKGDGSNPVLRVESALLVAGTTTASKTFVGWMPMQTGALSPGDTVFIPLFK